MVKLELSLGNSELVSITLFITVLGTVSIAIAWANPITGVGHNADDVGPGTMTGPISVTGGNFGVGTTSPIPHTAGTALVVSGDGSARAMLELWGENGGKAILESFNGDTYVGNLEDGTGDGRTYFTYGDGSHMITGTPRFFHIATLRAWKNFKNLARINTRKALRTGI